MKKFFLSLVMVLSLYSFTSFNSFFTDNVLTRFKNNSRLLYSEKLFLHIDRPLYFSGEDMWFQSYLLNAQSHISDTLEKVLYVELVNPLGAVVSKKMYKLNNGHCDGHFTIDNNLKSGNYLIVAYTNWMRNRGSDFYFTKAIKIVASNNDTFPKEISENPPLNRPEQFSKDTALHLLSNNRQPSNIVLQFFPEGGDLVDGLYTKVAYVNHYHIEKDKPLFGVIIDNNRDTVAQINPIYKGQGFFYFTPEYGKKYRAIYSYDNSGSFESVLPDVKQNGYRLGVVNEWKRDSLYIFIAASKGQQADQIINLIGQQDGNIKVAYEARLHEGSSIFKIAKSAFVTGIVQFTLFDSRGVPHCERLTYIKGGDQLSITVNGLDTVFRKRQKLSLELEVKDKLGRPVEGHFSMAVTDGLQLHDAHYGTTNIVNHLYLQSNLKGKIKDIDMLLLNNAYSHSCLDLLMMINGWRRFTWKEVLSDTLPEPDYYMEQGIFINGVVKRRSSNKTVPKGIDISMLMLGEEHNAYWAETNENGQFTFPISDFYDTTSVVVQTKNRLNQKADFNIELNSNLRFEPGDFNARERLLAQQEVSSIIYLGKELEEGEVQAVKGGMKENYKRLLEQGFFQDTTDILLDDIDVKAKVKKTPQQAITEEYGAASQVVGQRQIEDLIKDTPWYYGLTSLLFDAIPGLQVLERNNISELSKPNVFEDVFISDSLVFNSNDEFNVISSGKVVEFRMIDKGPHRVFLYVDGELVGVSDSKGVLYFMRDHLSVDDFISMDPKSIKSLELILSPKESPMRDMFADEIMAMQEMSGAEAILSIYTKDGSGIFARGHNRGMANFHLYGYVRQREFYSPKYEGEDAASILEDKRTTLYWNPSIITDKNGKANVTFYNSDVADQIRIHVEGISSDGIPGSLLQKTTVSSELSSIGENNNKENVEADNYEQNYTESLEVSMNNTVLSKKVILNNTTVASYASVQVANKKWSTMAGVDGNFAIDLNVIEPDDIIEINYRGMAHVAISLRELNSTDRPVILRSIDAEASTENPQKIVKQMRRRIISNSVVKGLFGEGVYRESMSKGNSLYRLSDFSFVLKKEAYRNSMDAHRSMILQGRDYRTEDYKMQVLYEPRTIINDPLPILDPLSLNLSFMASDADKNYHYVNEGVVGFMGRKAYKIEFTPKEDVAKALQEGTMLIDVETYALIYLNWRLSKQSKVYEMPQMYLMPGKEVKTFTVLDEHNEAFYDKIDGKWHLRAAVQNVSCEINGSALHYSRELLMQTYYNKRPDYFKRMNLNDINKRRLLIKNVKYRPEFWRDLWPLPSNNKINEQIKYLHEVTFYNGRE